MVTHRPSSILGAMIRRLALLTLVLSVPTAAQAQDDDPRIAEARERFEEADAAFESGDFERALSGFEASHQIMVEAGHPNAILVLFNIAASNERLDRQRVALTQFERFLAEAPADSPLREEAERRAEALRWELEGGDGDGGEDTGGGGMSPVGPIIAAIGGAALITGAILGGVALSESDAATADCVDMACPESARGDIEGAQTLANASDGLIFGGLAVAATGVILMFVLQDGGDDDASASAACGPTGCGVVVSGRF